MAIVRVRYNTHTSKRRIPLLVEYKCSKCGRDVSVRHVVEVEATKNTSVDCNRTEVARKLDEQSSNMMEKKFSKIVEEYKQGKYDELQLNIKCPGCKHKETWSKLRMTTLGCLSSLLIGFCLLGAFCGLIMWDLEVLFGCLGMGIGVGVVLVLIESLFRKLRYKQIAKLPKESLPKISIVEPRNVF